MAKGNGCSGYAGKISNKGAQEVKAVFPQSCGKSSKVTTGNDLRNKKGGKIRAINYGSPIFMSKIRKESAKILYYRRNSGKIQEEES